MRDGLSYELCEQQCIFHTLLGFCSSTLCDQSVQVRQHWFGGTFFISLLVLDCLFSN